MTELEAKLYWLFKERLKVLAPLRGVEMTDYQLIRISTDLAITAAPVLVKENANNYQGKR